MKNRYKLLTLVFILGISSTVIAQKNVVKLGILGLASKNVKLQYERVLTQRMSVQVGFSFLIPRDMPSRFTTSLLEEDSTGIANGYQNSLTSSVLKGISIIPELRIYTKKKDGAPNGFYWGPYLKYGKYTMGYDAIINNESITTTGSITSLGLGLTLGAHWIIKKRISIDWNFLSFGVNSNTFKIEAINNNHSSSGQVDTEWEEQVEADFKEIPIIGNNVTATSTANSATVVSKFIFPAIRSGFSIGFAF